VGVVHALSATSIAMMPSLNTICAVLVFIFPPRCFSLGSPAKHFGLRIAFPGFLSVTMLCRQKRNSPPFRQWMIRTSCSLLCSLASCSDRSNAFCLQYLEDGFPPADAQMLGEKASIANDYA
jgi:hypothetical protein